MAVRDVGSKLCVGVFAFEGVCGKQCAKKKSFAFAFLRHGCSICSLTFCLCMYTHTHTWIILYITETRYVFSLSLLRIALSAYLRRSHLAAAAAASLPLSLSLLTSLSSACSLTRAYITNCKRKKRRRQKSFLVLFSLLKDMKAYQVHFN